MTFTEKPTSARPKTIDGVTFRCWHVGIQKYVWRSEDGRLAAGSNFNLTTYWASALGEPRIPTKFRSLENAMRAAVKASR